MKPPILLKTILDICFVILLIGFIFPIFVFISMLFFGLEFPVDISGRTIENFNFKTITLIFADLTISAISIYIIYLLRKLIRSFFKNKFFTRLQISLLNLIGQLIILCTLGKFALNFFANLLLGNRAKLSFSIDSSFDSQVFILALGLFFIYLGKLFEKSRALQEENELTV